MYIYACGDMKKNWHIQFDYGVSSDKCGHIVHNRTNLAHFEHISVVVVEIRSKHTHRKNKSRVTAIASAAIATTAVTK